jgi:PBP1b-binding outer membrane lipoprotein LpoB
MKCLLLALLLVGCSPKAETIDEVTKFPNTPTMQSAEDAMKGKL